MKKTILNIIFTSIYFLVITPVSLFLALFKIDFLNKNLVKKNNSYWNFEK